MTLSAHKLGGPGGCRRAHRRRSCAVDGAAARRRTGARAARRHGEPGGHRRLRRRGRDRRRRARRHGEARHLRDDLERDARSPRCRAPSSSAPEAPRLANTSCLALPGVSSEMQVMALDLAGVAVSAGSACSSGKVQASHVLRAMGADAATAGSAIRVSLGWAQHGGGCGALSRGVERSPGAGSALPRRRLDGGVGAAMNARGESGPTAATSRSCRSISTTSRPRRPTRGW